MPYPLPQATGRRPSLTRRSARALLAAFGWRCVLVPPPAPKGIIIVYPHTSNWDFIVGVLYKFAVGLPARWMGKDTLFRWPVRRLIGMPPMRRNKLRTGQRNSVSLPIHRAGSPTANL